jgi:hypothetical protein
MGYLNQDIREGSFDDIGASGSIDGMCGDYIPSWESIPDLQQREVDMEEVWNYGVQACEYKE